MRKASRRLTQFYDDALAYSGIRSTQYAILAELNRRPMFPPTMQELADVMVMDRSALGHNLRPLERDGLLTLRQSNSDRRRRHVVLTQKGTEKAREAEQLWRTAQNRFVALFGEPNAAELRATLLEIAYDDRLSTLKY
ncbi:MarR family transcriptional regulator [Glaciimonas immobilis]|nr:MarR family transcriptional regulator [Glaciimonas immobilis]